MSSPEAPLDGLEDLLHGWATTAGCEAAQDGTARASRYPPVAGAGRRVIVLAMLPAGLGACLNDAHQRVMQPSVAPHGCGAEQALAVVGSERHSQRGSD